MEIPLARTYQRNYTPKSWQEKNAEAIQNSFNDFNLISDRGNFTVAPDPEFDYAKKAEQLASRIAQLRAKTAAQRAQNANIAVANSTVTMPNFSLGGMKIPKGKFGAFLKAIAGQESGGSYGAVNSGSGALGKYQIMPSNINGPGGWDFEALGKNVSTQAFLSNPKLQEAIARYKLQQYFNKYGAAGAASAWYSGDPNKWRNNSPQSGGPSIAAYVQAILRRMGQ